MVNREYYDYDDVVNWLKQEMSLKKCDLIWNEKVHKARGNQKVKYGKGGQ